MRFLRWQVSCRLLAVPHIMPFVDQTVLVMEKGMTGATGNWYSGLHEGPDMAFALHFLRADDLFVDVGANVGSYTILASGAVGARSISFEPIKQTFAKMQRNVAVNRLERLADCHNIGLGGENGVLYFTVQNDTTNHVATESEKSNGDVTEVLVRRLDDVLNDEVPSLIKIDVEGWEAQVLAGMSKTLTRSKLKAIIAETNAASLRYEESSECSVFRIMAENGFSPYSYDPFERRLVPGETPNNTIFLRDIEEVKQRLSSAKKFNLVNGQI